MHLQSRLAGVKSLHWVLVVIGVGVWLAAEKLQPVCDRDGSAVCSLQRCF